MTPFDEVMALARDTEALRMIEERLAWDQETVMPPGAGAQRAEEMGVLARMLHARKTDPRLGELLEVATPLDAVGAAQLRHLRRSYARSVKVPARLAGEIASCTSRAHEIWARARAEEDVASFLPALRDVVALKREEAAALAGGGDHYDALLDDYEPGATGARVQALFDGLRPRLVALRERIMTSGRQIAPLDRQFPENLQLALSSDLARIFGYDLSRGRIDKAVHPFSSGSGLDVRITTRTVPGDPFNCIYSTIHEVGHAAYEQGIDEAYLLTPLGRGVSMGVHESQSRIYENQLGRSRAFTGFLFGRMRGVFGDFGVADAETFHAIVNRVSPGYIRTEADEVQYNLHVMLRFDLERDLIGGSLEVHHLEEAWNARFARDFGVAVDRPSNGLLQDIHWSAGLFGYFATYTLGNVYAGCLHEALRAAVPDLDDQLAAGDLAAATGWLGANVQRTGGLHEPEETIRRATGHAPGVEPLLDYLENKFGAIYGL